LITQLSRILSPARCLAKVSADSRKRVLEKISEMCANELSDIVSRDIFDAFVARERLGSTAMGQGVAVPHVRFDGIEQPIAVLLQLLNPVDYDAPDKQKVDLFFGFLVPVGAQGEHLRVLSQVAGMFGDEAMREELRKAENEQILYQLVLDHERKSLARDDTLPGLIGGDEDDGQIDEKN
jgi:PTS system nitrogen regulatory IIA component